MLPLLTCHPVIFSNSSPTFSSFPIPGRISHSPPYPLPPPPKAMSSGKKRASPGADEAKPALSDVELSEQDATKLAQLSREFNRIEIAVGAPFPPPHLLLYPKKANAVIR